MKREEIMNMPAGRKMDKEIHKLVFGKDVSRFSSWSHGGLTMEFGASIPDYSTEIEDAWEVVERFENRCMLNNVHGIWECYLPENAKGEAKSVPLAICRAALMAVME